MHVTPPVDYTLYLSYRI